MEHHTFSKFMHDLIDSGIWSKLSSTARTLYPVLCKFSNESFKEVWPGTEELLRLTGFKTKKSLQQAKKDLIKAGLIDIIPGKGRTPSKYFFKFDYVNSCINLDSYRDTIIHLRGVNFSPSEVSKTHIQRDANLSPNNINININTNNDKQTQFYESIEKLLKDFFASSKLSTTQFHKDQIIQSMLEKYGNLETGEAIKIAIERGKSGDIKYLEGILRNRQGQPKYNQDNPRLDKHIIVLNELSKKYNNIHQDLQYHYFYNNTYYFKTKHLLNFNEIEKYAKDLNFNIKIIHSNVDSETPNIRFMNQI